MPLSSHYNAFIGFFQLLWGGRGDFLHFFLHFRFYCVKIGPEPPKYSVRAVTFGVHGTIAQLVEQMTFNHWVQGSSPCGPTTILAAFAAIFIFLIFDICCSIIPIC